MNEYLTQSEIQELEIYSWHSMPNRYETVPSGLIYDDKGFIAGKTPNFIYDQSLEYKRSNNILEIEKPKFEVIDWLTLNTMVFPKEKWRINLLIPKAGIVILASPSGEKKTWLAMDMARCMTVGENFAGYEGFKTESCNVLYINGEMSKQELQRRGRQLGFSEQSKNLFIITQDEIDLSDPEAIDEIQELVKQNDIGIIFVDTLRAVAGGLKEEKAEEVREFFNRLMPLKNLGITIVFLDHCRKPQRFEGKEPKKEQLFSSQDKVANAEVLLMIKSEAGSDDVAVYQKKNRLGKEIQPFKLLMEDVKDEFEVVTATKLIYSGNFEEKEFKLDEAKELILGALADGTKTINEFVELGKQEEIGASNIRRAIKSLKEHKHIQKNGKRSREDLYILPIEENQTIDLGGLGTGEVVN